MPSTRRIFVPFFNLSKFLGLMGAVLLYSVVALKAPGALPAFAAPAPAPVTSNDAFGLQSAVVRATRTISPTVVNIDTSLRSASDEEDPYSVPVPRKGQGSGVIVSHDGLILTNDHVVRGASEIIVTLSDKRRFKASIKGADRLSDIAVLKINASGLPAARLGDSDALPIGSFVIAVGNPLGYDHTMTMGVLSGRGRELPEPGKEFRNLLQTDAAINPGNSGGPLADLHGNVIGINTAIIPRAQGIGFAIPINTARRIMRDLVANGHVVRPYLGVYMEPVTQEVARLLKLPRVEGIFIQRVVPNSPAAAAGLSRGDVILEIDGKPVSDVVAFQDQVRSHRIGEEVALKVWSEAHTGNVKVRLSEMPSS